jgi:hypothetical protein
MHKIFDMTVKFDTLHTHFDIAALNKTPLIQRGD